MTPYDPVAAPNSAASNGAVASCPIRSRARPPVQQSEPAELLYDRFRCHVDPRQIMDVGVMNGNMPAPMMASTKMTSSS